MARKKKKSKGTIVEISGGGVRPWGARRNLPPAVQFPVVALTGLALILILVGGIAFWCGWGLAVLLAFFLMTRGRR